MPRRADITHAKRIRTIAKKHSVSYKTARGYWDDAYDGSCKDADNRAACAMAVMLKRIKSRKESTSDCQYAVNRFLCDTDLSSIVNSLIKGR